MNANVLISGSDLIVSLLFAVLVLRQYIERKKTHQLMWTIALIVWTIAVEAELIATLNGWSPLIYRTYYATGALMIPAWLGMGTLYLVAPRRWADLILVGLAILSLIGIVLIAFWSIDPAALKSAPNQFVPLRVFPFFPVQLVLIVLNVFGSVAFIGGALWSAYAFARSKTMGERVWATLSIALGGLIAAVAHSLGVFGDVELFRISEFVAVIFIFAGFVLSTPLTSRKTASAPRSVGS